ncbi:MAG: alpha/beta hydrolase [Burkholderiales bacterium]
MRASTRREYVDGPTGRIECAVDAPDGAPAGIALVAHPHPLYGGTLDNKVAQTLARACVAQGAVAYRPNFRGVGATEGVHDGGRGELEDLAAVLAYAARQHGALPVTLAGFSFGAALQVQLAARVMPARLALVGVAVTAFELPHAPSGALVVHGELDDTVPLAAVLDWARPQELPVIVLPGADHFFHRRLNLLRDLVARYLR